MDRTVLIVADGSGEAQRVSALLEGDGYQVQLATGDQALERIRRTPPDLIVADIAMAEMDGYAVCRAIKSGEGTRTIPVVLLTDRRLPLNIIKGLEAGADNFITRPFDDDHLLERVGRIFQQLDRRRPGRRDADVTIQLGGRQFTASADTPQLVELLIACVEELGAVEVQLEHARHEFDEYARNLERMVEERTQDLRNLFDGVPIGLFCSTPEGVILDANPACVQMLAYEHPEALLKTPMHDLHVHGADRQRLLALLERDGVVRDFEVQLRRRDGSPFWAQISVRTVGSPDQEVLYHEGAIQDISERKRVEEEMQRQRDARYQSEKIATMGALLAGVAHELNNPLAVVMGQATLLRSVTQGSPLAVRAEKINTAAERCVRIVRNFLAVARQRPPERGPVRLNQILTEAVELLAYELRGENIEVILDTAPDLPRLWADGHQLRQVVVNLIANAQQALHRSAPPRRLTLTTRLDVARGGVVLQVADSGPGLPAEILAQVFEPFFTTTPAGEGTGLGLSLCRGVVEEHGGSIHAESRPGHGATFTIELPLVLPPTSADDAAALDCLPPAGPAAILVVDDEPDLAAVMCEALEADGHRTAVAPNGALALEMLAAAAYDLVITDGKMPVLDGVGFYQELERRFPALRQRVIFITGDVMSCGKREYIERTGLPVLAKPVDVLEVRRVVRRMLAGPATPSPAMA